METLEKIGPFDVRGGVDDAFGLDSASNSEDATFLAAGRTGLSDCVPAERRSRSGAEDFWTSECACAVQ